VSHALVHHRARSSSRPEPESFRRHVIVEAGVRRGPPQTVSTASAQFDTRGWAPDGRAMRGLLLQPLTACAILSARGCWHRRTARHPSELAARFPATRLSASAPEHAPLLGPHPYPARNRSWSWSIATEDTRRTSRRHRCHSRRCLDRRPSMSETGPQPAACGFQRTDPTRAAEQEIPRWGPAAQSVTGLAAGTSGRHRKRLPVANRRIDLVAPQVASASNRFARFVYDDDVFRALHGPTTSASASMAAEKSRYRSHHWSSFFPASLAPIQDQRVVARRRSYTHCPPPLPGAMNTGPGLSNRVVPRTTENLALRRTAVDRCRSLAAENPHRRRAFHVGKLTGFDVSSPHPHNCNAWRGWTKRVVASFC